MMTNKQIIKTARKYKGDGGSRFRKFCGLPNGAAWCNAYVDYVAYEADASQYYFNGKKETYCPHSMAWCKKNLAEIPPYMAMAGDIIYFDWERNKVPNHIGLVVNKIDTEKVRTIEGNTSGGIVAEKIRVAKYECGIFRPKMKGDFTLGKIKCDSNFEYNSIANLQAALGLTPTSVLDIQTVKALQKLTGATPDGCWRKNTSKSIQKFLKKNGFYDGAIDGDFGPKSVKALQKYINAKNGHTESDGPKPEKYSGTFPLLPPKTAKIAVKCAYAYGTKLSVYKYSGGKPKKEYKEKLNKAYPHRSHWKHAKSRAGASCDVFVGVILKLSGYKHAPHAMSKFVAWCRRNLKKVSSLQNGDILTRTNHIMVVVDLKGKKRVANAHFLDHGGTYPVIEKIGAYTNIWRTEGVSYFSKGDTFTDVRKLKKVLNWYGGYGLTLDYDFDNLTEYAVKDFQRQEGLPVNGRFGQDDLDRMKAVRK